ncbi:MAG TPA: hypothetical protein VH188_05095 [Chthoniobacterales bacterium]|jgi:hypothetical protein|nr:hypothetical protein [Chthoniobacterales bacterium]
MAPLILVALCAILLPLGSVIILSVALLLLRKPQTPRAVLACVLSSAIAVVFALLCWGKATHFFGSETGSVPRFVVTPALVCATIGVVTATVAVVAGQRRVAGTTLRAPLWRVLITVSAVILVSAIAVVFGGLAYLERDTWKTSSRISKALRNARSVTLVEFARQSVLARKTATPEDVVRFQHALSPWFLPYAPPGALCSVPHHRVEIVSADGTELTFFVCFLCGNFYVEPTAIDASTGGAVDLPPSWEKPLTSFFASIGMRPKSDEEYRAFPDADSNDSKANSEN